MIRIVIYGAESTGKTTLAQALAQHFNTAWVPEYSRAYLQQKMEQTGAICAYEDLMPIARGQLELERKCAQEAQNNILFCDTNILQTYYYGKAYYPNFNHPALWELTQAQKYDFYLLTYIDTPWVADDLRDRPHQREAMHQLFENSLIQNDLPYELIKGNKREKLEKAIDKINILLNNTLF